MSKGLIGAEGGGLVPGTAYGGALFRRFVEHVRGQGVASPSALVLGTIPLEGPDDRLEALRAAGCGRAEAMLVTPPDADDPAVARRIAEADILFLRGGDQSRYLYWWWQSAAAEAIRSVHARGGVVSGTSAGCAILGSWSFDARVDGLSPREALSDSRHPCLTLTRDFLGLTPGTLFDTHFTERGRLPRLALMLMHALEADRGDNRAPATSGVGIEASTCVLAREDRFEVMGLGNATLVAAGEATRTVLEAGAPPAIIGLAMSVLAPGTVWNSAGEVSKRPEWAAARPHPEVIEESGFAPALLRGNEPDSARAGAWVITALRRASGAPKVEPGDGLIPATFLCGLWSGMNIRAALLAGLRTLAAPGAGPLVLMDGGCAARVDERGLIKFVGEGTAPSSAVVIDAANAAHVGVGDSPEAAEDAAHLPHIEGATLHVLPPGWGYDLARREARSPA